MKMESSWRKLELRLCEGLRPSCLWCGASSPRKSLARTSGEPEPVAPDLGEHVGQLAHRSACPPSQSVAVLLMQVLGPAVERSRSSALTFMMWGGGRCAPYLTSKFSGQPENGIHPKRIPAMLRLLQDIATDVDEPVGPDNPRGRSSSIPIPPPSSARCRMIP